MLEALLEVWRAIGMLILFLLAVACVIAIILHALADKHRRAREDDANCMFGDWQSVDTPNFPSSPAPRSEATNSVIDHRHEFVFLAPDRVLTGLVVGAFGVEALSFFWGL